jgi:hypothetical protein
LLSCDPVLVPRASDLEDVEDVEVVTLVNLRKRFLLARVRILAIEKNRIDPEFN